MATDGVLSTLEELIGLLSGQEEAADGLLNGRNFAALVSSWRAAVQTSHHAVLVCTGLERFNAQIRQGETTLLRTYVQSSPECPELFAVLDSQAGRAFPVAARILDLFAHILTPAVCDASPVVAKNLSRKLLKTKLKLVYRLLAAEDNRVVHSPLRLLIAIVKQGGSIARELCQTFNFSLKPFLALPFRPFSKAAEAHADQAQRTRQLFIDFAMAFLNLGEPELTQIVLNIKGLIGPLLKVA